MSETDPSDDAAPAAAQPPAARGRPSSAEPIPAPLPMTRYEERPGVWADPEAQPGADGEAETEALPVAPVPAGALDYAAALPRQSARRHFGTPISFLLAVVLPTLFLVFYYYGIADDEYFAEFRFSVTSGTPVLPGTPSSSLTPSSGPAGGLASLLGGGSAQAASPQNFIVTDYLNSRQVVDDLQQRVDLRKIYSRPQINRWQRFDTSQPDEALARYFRRYASADYDQVTGLAIASVRAFTADDAGLLARTMADLAENLVNQINTRSYQDAVHSAEAEVQRAQQRLKEVNTQLLQYRAREQVINPDNSVVATNIQLMQTLQGNLVNLRTQLGAQQAAHLDTGNSPTARQLQAQIASTERQVQALERQIAHDSGGSTALAQVVGQYEQLTLDQQYAQTMVLQTLQALDIARANAVAQHLYIVPYVSPVTPHSATFPRRALDILLGAIISFGVWLGGLLVVRSIQDHAI